MEENRMPGAKQFDSPVLLSLNWQGIAGLSFEFYK